MNGSYFVSRENCPACKSSNRQELYSKSYSDPPISTYLNDFYSPQGAIEFDYLKGATFVLDECKECGLIYQRSIPNDFLMTKLYEEWIDPEKVFKSNVKCRSVELYIQMSREIEMVIKHFGVLPSELGLFDFGMGWGDWCCFAKAYGCSAYGSELSQVRIDYARKSGITIIDWEEIPEHEFDFINTEQVFEHIADPLDTLQYLSKALKPRGIIKISVPNGYDIRRRLAVMDWTAAKGSRNSLNPVAPLEHINCFSQDSLLRMAQIADLEPVQIHAKIRMDKGLLDATLRDFLRPFYNRVMKARNNHEVGSTKICFKKRTA